MFSIILSQLSMSSEMHFLSLFQVMALCQAPMLMDDPNVSILFPADVIARAKHYLAMTTGGLGKYMLIIFSALRCDSFVSFLFNNICIQTC